MANELLNSATLSNFDDVILAATIEEVIKEELGAGVVIAPLVRVKDLSGTGSHVWNVPIWAAPPTTASVAEPDDMALSAVTTTVKQVTASEVGVMTGITDKLRVGNVIGEELAVIIGQGLGRSMARYIDTTIAALFTDLNGGTGIGTSGANMTESDFLEAMYTLEAANAVGPKVCVLHPRQAGDLRADLMVTTETLYGTPTNTLTVGLGHTATISDDRMGFRNDATGYWTTIYGIPIFQTTVCPLVNTSADRSGAMFVAGSCIGMAYHWLGRIEFERNASGRFTEIVSTSDVGFGEIADGEGCPIETDA